jgi:PKD repeat protein
MLEAAGMYSANLTAVNGCDSLSTLALQVQPIPTAQFNFIANNGEVTFTNNSTNATTHFWDFGDNFSSKELAPTHQYAANGIYTVTLSESNACGVSTFQQTVVIMVSNTINQRKNIGWSVFPNPSSGTFFVKSAGATTRIAKLALFDLTGRQIQIGHQMLNQIYLVDCSGISNGIYLLQLSEENSPVFWTRVVICN